jgi:transcription-repair coupling factor (superfamily II helicase)
LTVKWLDPMLRWDEFIKMKKAVQEGIGPTLVFGLSETQKSHAVSSLLYPIEGQCLFITYSDTRAKEIYEDLKFYIGEKAMYLPPRDIVFYSVAAHSTDLLGQRLRVVEALALGQSKVVVASIEALLCLQTPPKIFKDRVVRLEIGEELPLGVLTRRIVEMGYERVPAIEGRGQFSIRGGILDIYPMTMDAPCRIEFFDDEIDSIRFFDPLSQRSTGKLSSLSISPARELVLSRKTVDEGIAKIREELSKSLRRGKNTKKSGMEEKIATLIEEY